jgi:hypothetical protein
VPKRDTVEHVADPRTDIHRRDPPHDHTIAIIIVAYNARAFALNARTKNKLRDRLATDSFT